ncbi:MAG: DUF3098 domain-containing protein [Chlorobiota bacterium]
MAKKREIKRSNVKWEFPLTRKNYIIAGIGLATIIVGYLLMSTGLGGEYAKVDGTWNNPMAVTIAPLLLVIGYCVIIPMAIFKYFPHGDSNE